MRAPLILGAIALVIAGAGWSLLGPNPEPGGPGGGELAPSNPNSGTFDAPAQTSRLLGLSDRADLDTGSTRTNIADLPSSKATQHDPGPGEGRISGWVKVAMRPIGGATVTAYGEDGLPLDTTTSLIDGSWALFIEPGESFKLRASYPMTVPMERQEPALAEGDMRRAGNLVLAMGRRVAGTILDEAGSPIPGAWATVARATTQDFDLRNSVNGLGVFSLENTPLASTLEAGAPGYATQAFRAADSDSTDGIAIVLVPGRRAEVKITDPLGNPVAGANVLFVEAIIATGQGKRATTHLIGRVPEAGSPESRHSVLTDADGMAITATLGPGLYWAEATHADFDSAAPERIPSLEESAANPLEVEAQLSFLSRLQFRVVNKSTGLAVPGVAVFAEGLGQRTTLLDCAPSDQVVDQVTTTEGSYHAFAWAEGFHVGSLELKAEQLPPFGSDQEVFAKLPVLVLTPADSRQLFVVDAAGAPIPGATMVLSMEPSSDHGNRTLPSELGWHLGKTSAASPTALQHLSESDWPTLTIQAPGFVDQAVSRDNWPWEEQTGDITVTMVLSAELLVRVVAPEGPAILGAQVYLTLEGTAALTPYRTDANGEVLITGIGFGEGTLMARGPGGHLSQRESFTLELAGRAEVVLTLRE